MRQRPCAVIVDIADEAELAAPLQDARHGGDGCILNEAPLPVPPLRPGIGMDQVDPRQRARGRPGQQFGGIAREQPDVADLLGLDLRQDLGHAVDIGLAADEPGIRKGACFRDQMLAATEPDFEPDFGGRRVEQCGEVGRAGIADVERKMRQQVLDQLGLVQTEFVALAPPEERTVRVNGAAVVARRLVAIGRIAAGAGHRSV